MAIHIMGYVSIRYMTIPNLRISSLSLCRSNKPTFPHIMKKNRILYLLLVIGLFLPLTLRGQEEGILSTINGQVFSYGMPPPPMPSSIYFPPPRDSYVTLVADGDTLKTDMTMHGIFSFSEIRAKRAIISVVGEDTDGMIIYYTGIFDLMPGENVVLIPLERVAVGFSSLSHAIITLEGNDWVYHYPGMKGIGQYVADRLKAFPGVKYSKRKETVTIPEGGIYRAYIDGAYIFALKPEAE